MKKFLFCILSFMMFTIPVLAKEDLAPNSESAILLEVSTGKILYEKNADSKLAPASMTKIMSMLLIMEAVDDGKISMDDEVIISENAASMGGSQIFLQAGEKYKVEELLKGIAVASGNDAVVAMAEKVGGSVDGFVEMMNKRAEELGLTNTHFDNPHGLDSETHYTTARDMSVMARELLKHEKILEFTSIYEDYLKKNDGSSIWLVNTNRLVRFYEGVDGLKTGYTTNAGYCITTTALRNNLRLLSVVMNAPSSDLRSKDTTNMLNYGFNNYKLDILLDKDNDLGNLSIIKGKKETTKIYLKDNVTILSKINDEKGTYDYNIVIEKENAPIESNEKVGYVEVIDNEGNIIKEQDLIVKEEIKKANIWDLFKKTLSTISSGNFT
jgi:D-alanyl-D-alanine carboxypeptidase (penicillin-binding protein 5/6)